MQLTEESGTQHRYNWAGLRMSIGSNIQGSEEESGPR